MNPTFYLFLVIGIVYYALGHQLTQIQRKIEGLREGLRDDIRKDIKHEIELHEIRTS